jgi:hypothetical protein
LQLGKSRREIDEEISRRMSALLKAPAEATAKPEARAAEFDDGTNLPEGYE